MVRPLHEFKTLIIRKVIAILGCAVIFTVYSSAHTLSLLVGKGNADTPPHSSDSLCNNSDSAREAFAFKTNLLYDAASLINLGIEIPIGKRFSLAADAEFPWWRNRKNDITIQMLGGTVEGKIWFGKKPLDAAMTGFFAGVYGGAGIFDFQLGKLTRGYGVQGDFYVFGGLSAGYAHQISNNLRMEYSLGVGYLSCDFREYESAKDTKYGDIKVIPYPWTVKRFSGILPTKASVSLVWVLKTRKGGGR